MVFKLKMEKELKERDERKKVLDYTLNSLLMGTLKGAAVGFPIRIIFRSPALGYFILAYSIGISLHKSNDFLLESLKDV